MRLLLFALATLFLCASCAASQYNKTFANLHGSRIDQAAALLGPPDRKEENFYVWSKSRIVRGGGYETTRYDTRYEQSPQGKLVMRQIPIRQWVAPYEDRLWCETVIYFSKDGTIVEHSINGNDCP